MPKPVMTDVPKGDLARFKGGLRFTVTDEQRFNKIIRALQRAGFIPGSTNVGARIRTEFWIHPLTGKVARMSLDTQRVRTTTERIIDR